MFILAGCIVDGGRVACNCDECKGSTVNLLQFEEHSGSWERYKTGNMILSNYDVSLKASASALISLSGFLTSLNQLAGSVNLQ